MLEQYFTYLAKKNPILSYKLYQAGMPDKPDEFIRKAHILALIVSITLSAVFYVFMNMLELPIYFLIIAFIVLFYILKFFFIHQPDAIITRREKEINKEIVFATRFLLIEVQSGVSLFDAIINLRNNYHAIGKEFSDIINLINLGTSLEDAIEQLSEKTPSESLRKVLWQILNSLKTGADIGTSLEASIEQITREQMIAVEEYGRKLNPLAMFYMILAVILPSIGITMGVLLSGFLSFDFDLSRLLTLAGGIAFMQLMFYNTIKSMRPPVDL